MMWLIFGDILVYHLKFTSVSRDIASCGANIEETNVLHKVVWLVGGGCGGGVIT